MTRWLALLLAIALAACGSTEERAPRSVRTDVQRLQAALTDDPAQLVLDEVDDAIARQRPVMAADLLEDGAIPAVRRHIDTIQHLEMTTSEGQTYRTRALRLLRTRVTALIHWQTALARGIGHEDESLLDALHETAEAEHALADFHAELATVRPLESGEGGDRSEALEGLPPLAPPTSGEGDDTVTPPPAPDPHGADPIDGREDTTEPPEPPGLRAPHEPELPEDREDHHAIEPHGDPHGR
ncbi:MAG: hypothetical protein U0234_03355 [Sandaracinus sp.]